MSDFEPRERAHGRSMSLSVAPLVHRGVKVNLIDTPGYADFVGELRAGLRAADCALFVIAANEPVDARDRRAVARVRRRGHAAGGRRDQARPCARRLRRRAGGRPGDVRWRRRQGAAAVVPVMSGTEVTGLVALLGRTAATSTPTYATPLIEGIIEESEDEGLMDRYLDGEQVSEDMLLEDLHRAMARGSFFPVDPGLLDERRGLRRAARPDGPRLPGALGAPGPEAFTPGGQAHRPGDLRPGRPAAGRGRQDRRATPTSAGSAWSGCSPAPWTPTTRCTSRDTSPRSSARSRARGPRRRRAGRLARPPVRPAA